MSKLNPNAKPFVPVKVIRLNPPVLASEMRYGYKPIWGIEDLDRINNLLIKIRDNKPEKVEKTSTDITFNSVVSDTFGDKNLNFYFLNE